MIGLRQIVYVAFLLLSCGYSMIAGGRTERAAVIIVIAGTMASWAAAASTAMAWHRPMLGIALIDCSVAAAFFLLASKGRKFWPIWSFGFATAGASTHLARLLEHDVPFMAYFDTEALWAYPAIMAMVVGTLARRGHVRMPTLS